MSILISENFFSILGIHWYFDLLSKICRYRKIKDQLEFIFMTKTNLLTSWIQGTNNHAIIFCIDTLRLWLTFVKVDL